MCAVTCCCNCCGLSYADLTTNVSMYTLVFFGIPLILDVLVYTVHLVVWIVMMKHLLFTKFTIGFMINSSTDDGIYEVYYNFTTFFATFTQATMYGPACLDYNPVVIFKVALAISIISSIFQSILMRVSCVLL